MTTEVLTKELTAGTWAIDPVHSSIQFSVRHMMVSKVRGNFTSFSGVIVVEADGTATVSAEIAIDSITTGNEQRDGHVKSKDFFDAAKYPAAQFHSTRVTMRGDSYAVDGDLTLKGVTKPVRLDLVFGGVNPGAEQGPVAGFEAFVELNRKEFGIDLELPMPTGGVVVGDKVAVTLDIEAVKQG
ncbi:YceI family protein [Mycolicibacterium moriokaense]|uniref:Polyisoprenoid-binding protein YceI n=1 Tax=Mycolicibacterium moriokaense TaxID=39691 RepID=A0A318H7A4_9MYCO|nr:YceI family protein [Mycolicibacterium moriokaense]PXX00379.1 polyisoprenoid-binding protein YceI [Mycolicibacterium moriokaense]